MAPRLGVVGGTDAARSQPRAVLGVPGGQDVVEPTEVVRDLPHLVVAERAPVPGLEGRADGAGDLLGQGVAGRATAHADLPGEGRRGDGAGVGGAVDTGGLRVHSYSMIGLLPDEHSMNGGRRFVHHSFIGDGSRDHHSTRLGRTRRT